MWISVVQLAVPFYALSFLEILVQVFLLYEHRSEGLHGGSANIHKAQGAKTTSVQPGLAQDFLPLEAACQMLPSLTQ